MKIKAGHRVNEQMAGNLDWRGLLDRHGRALLLYARQWCGSLADAEDAVQEGVVKFWRFWRGGEYDPVPYLFKAVKHSAIDQRRRQDRRRIWEDKAKMESEEATVVALFEPAAEAEEEAERRKMIEDVLNTLPSEQKEVVMMKIWGDLTFEQIGMTLGISANTAASRYRYALNAMRRQLDQEKIR